jgi:hypothetical protein
MPMPASRSRARCNTGVEAAGTGAGAWLMGVAVGVLTGVVVGDAALQTGALDIQSDVGPESQQTAD